MACLKTEKRIDTKIVISNVTGQSDSTHTRAHHAREEAAVFEEEGIIMS